MHAAVVADLGGEINGSQVVHGRYFRQLGRDKVRLCEGSGVNHQIECIIEAHQANSGAGGRVSLELGGHDDEPLLHLAAHGRKAIEAGHGAGVRHWGEVQTFTRQF